MLACVQSRNVVMVLKQVNSLRDRSARSSLRATVWLGPPRTAYGNVRFWRTADVPLAVVLIADKYGTYPNSNLKLYRAMHLTKIGHVLIAVHDLARSKEFYTRVLGLEILEEDPDHGGYF